MQTFLHVISSDLISNLQGIIAFCLDETAVLGIPIVKSVVVEQWVIWGRGLNTRCDLCFISIYPHSNYFPLTLTASCCLCVLWPCLQYLIYQNCCNMTLLRLHTDPGIMSNLCIFESPAFSLRFVLGPILYCLH